MILCLNKQKNKKGISQNLDNITGQLKITKEKYEEIDELLATDGGVQNNKNNRVNRTKLFTIPLFKNLFKEYISSNYKILKAENI